MSWPGSRYYPSLVWRSIQASEKFSVTVRKSSSPQRNTKSFYCLQPTRGMYLHTAKSTRRCGEIFPLEVRAILSAFTSATYGRSYIRHLQMLPSPSDPSGKSDIALKYKQRNKSQQSDPPRLLFFFSILHNLYPSCILRQYVKPPGRDAADVDQQLLQEPDPSIRYRCSRTPMRGIE